MSHKAHEWDPLTTPLRYSKDGVVPVQPKDVELKGKHAFNPAVHEVTYAASGTRFSARLAERSKTERRSPSPESESSECGSDTKECYSPQAPASTNDSEQRREKILGPFKNSTARMFGQLYAESLGFRRKGNSIRDGGRQDSQ
jgi:hypothetical protein